MNSEITKFLKDKLGFSVSDAFCGYRAYKVSGLKEFDLAVNDYGLPLQVWVQVFSLGMRFKEIPVFADFSSHDKRDYDETLGSFEDTLNRLN